MYFMGIRSSLIQFRFALESIKANVWSWKSSSILRVILTHNFLVLTFVILCIKDSNCSSLIEFSSLLYLGISSSEGE